MGKDKRWIGIALILISVLGLYAWESWGKGKFLYDEVLVLRKNLERGTIVTEEMLTVRKMDIDEAYISFDDRETIMGKQTAGFVHKGVPLFAEYFQDAALTPDEKHHRYGLCVSAEWIASKPEGLTRSDRILLFCGRDFMTEALVCNLDEDGSIEVILTKEKIAEICGIVQNGRKLVVVRV